MGVARLLLSTPWVRGPAKPFMFAVEKKLRSRSRAGKCLPKPPSSRSWMTCSGWNEGFMILARVIGQIVATQKEPSHEGKKILLVQPLTIHEEPLGDPLVALDAVG